MRSSSQPRQQYQTHARLSPSQQATLESLERHAMMHGYQSLTRREKSTLINLRNAMQQSYAQ